VENKAFVLSLHNKIKEFVVAFVNITEPFQLRHNKITNQCRGQSIGPKRMSIRIGIDT
jgi:hypothetical protein